MSEQQSSIQVPDFFSVEVAVGDVVEVISVREEAPRTMRYKGWGFLLVQRVTEDYVHGVWCDDKGYQTIEGEVPIDPACITGVAISAAAREAERDESARRRAQRHALRRRLAGLGYRRATKTVPMPDGSWIEAWTLDSVTVSIVYGEDEGYAGK